jgi:hypothetical protein
MDWVVVACSVVMAWVTLCVISGERMRRDQARQAELLSRPPVKSRPPAADHHRKAA